MKAALGKIKNTNATIPAFRPIIKLTMKFMIMIMIII